MSTKSNSTFDAGPATNGIGSRDIRVKLTHKEHKRVTDMIKNAMSIREIEDLEKMLSEGKIPGGILDALKE